MIFIVTLVCGLATAFGPQAGKMALFINLWMMIALSLSAALYAPINLALGFFCGIGIAFVLGIIALLEYPAGRSKTSRSRLVSLTRPMLCQCHQTLTWLRRGCTF